MSRKSQGISREREIVEQCYERGYVATRVAASGGTNRPEPDIIIGGHPTNYAVEAKTTGKDKKYFSKDEVRQLCFYAKNHNACMPLLGVRFKGDKTWWFAPPRDVRKTAKSFVMSKDETESYKKLPAMFPQRDHEEVPSE